MKIYMLIGNREYIFLIDIRLRFGKEEDRLESGFFDRGNIY